MSPEIEVILIDAQFQRRILFDWCIPVRHTKCNSFGYQTVAPTNTNDRECSMLVSCNDNEYESSNLLLIVIVCILLLQFVQIQNMYKLNQKLMKMVCLLVIEYV